MSATTTTYGMASVVDWARRICQAAGYVVIPEDRYDAEQEDAISAAVEYEAHCCGCATVGEAACPKHFDA